MTTAMSPRLRHTLWLILSLVSALSMWRYVTHVWGAGQSDQFSDLYARWWGAHELLLHHRDPYSPAVAHEIQTVIYGEPIAASYPGDPAELTGGFAYPVYVVFLLWPTLHLAFPVVQTITISLFVALTLASLVLWLHALRWQPAATESIMLAVLTIGSFPVLQGLRLQNLSLLVSSLVAAAMASLVADRLTLAGLLLAGATIKPQFMILLVPWLAFWIAGDWQRRQRLAWSFSAAMSVLVLGGEIVAPGWITKFLAVVQAYRQYTYGHSLLDIWFTTRVGPTVALTLALAVLAICWRFRSQPASSSRFFLASSLVLATTLVVIPTLEPHAQLLLLPGFLFLLRHRSNIWQSSRLARLFLAALCTLLAWPWFAALGMTLATIWIPAGTLRQAWALPLYPSPVIPFGALVVLGFLLASDAGTFRNRGAILES